MVDKIRQLQIDLWFIEDQGLDLAGSAVQGVNGDPDRYVYVVSNDRVHNAINEIPRIQGKGYDISAAVAHFQEEAKKRADFIAVEQVDVHSTLMLLAGVGIGVGMGLPGNGG